jgi:hypothetical protein
MFAPSSRPPFVFQETLQVTLAVLRVFAPPPNGPQGGNHPQGQLTFGARKPGASRADFGEGLPFSRAAAKKSGPRALAIPADHTTSRIVVPP